MIFHAHCHQKSVPHANADVRSNLGEQTMAAQPQVVVITGGSAGVGRAAAGAFAQRGAKVAVLARGQERLNRTVEELKQRGAAEHIGWYKGAAALGIVAGALAVGVIAGVISRCSRR